MMREPIVASRMMIVLITRSAVTNAQVGSSWPSRTAIATHVIGRNVSTPVTAVRGPVLGITIARSSTMNDA